MSTQTENKQTDARPSAGSATEWQKRKVHEGVTLPSGMVVDLELPDLPELARAGDIPNELLEASGKLQKAVDDGDRSQVTTETLANVAEFMRYLIPRMVVKPKIDEEKVDKIPPEDKELLVAFAQRARDIDAVGRHLAGLEVLAEWRRFRGWETADEAVGGV